MTRTHDRQRESGRTLLEIVVVAALVMVMAGISVPHLKAYAVEASLMGAARQFKGTFRLARSTAIRLNVYTAIRFEETAGVWRYSVYADGDFDGVQSADIQSGRDWRVAGPFPLDAGTRGVRLGINPRVPAIPPESGWLDPGDDPIRFGADMLSFSPLGTATPGTLYIAGETRQAAVRVTAGSARVRLLVCRGHKWQEQS
jgi:hypothetical protein